MIVPIVGCILAGCLQDVPVIVGRDPVLYYLEQKPKKVSPKAACYVEGVFHKECPNRYAL